MSKIILLFSLEIVQQLRNCTNACTVYWENFTVKIISQSRPTAKIWHAKNKLTRRQSTKTPARKSTISRSKCPIDDYSQWSLALLLHGSRLNARNFPGTRPYCNRQLIKKITPEQTKPRKINTENFSRKLFLTWKFPDLRYMHNACTTFTTLAPWGAL